MFREWWYFMIKIFLFTRMSKYYNIYLKLMLYILFGYGDIFYSILYL